LFLPGKGASFNEIQASETKWIDLAIIRKEDFQLNYKGVFDV